MESWLNNNIISYRRWWLPPVVAPMSSSIWSHPLHILPCPPLPAFVTRLFSWVERCWNRGERLRRRRSAGEKSRGSERGSCRGWCHKGPRPTTLIWLCRRPTRVNSKSSGRSWATASVPSDWNWLELCAGGRSCSAGGSTSRRSRRCRGGWWGDHCCWSRLPR